jgi:hypothetical protein
VNTIKIDWAEPYARVYQVQYWVGTGDAMDDQASGDWKTFPGAEFRAAKGGDVTLRLADTPVKLRYVRVLMTESSNTCDTHGSADKRNCVGYAINEVYLGATDASGKFTDYVRHTKGQDQTYTLCSSVDPWHQASDLLTAPNQMWSGDQPGFDPFLHERNHARDAGDHSHRAGVRSAGRFGESDRVHREARISDRARRDG